MDIVIYYLKLLRILYERIVPTCCDPGSVRRTPCEVFPLILRAHLRISSLNPSDSNDWVLLVSVRRNLPGNFGPRHSRKILDLDEDFVAYSFPGKFRRLIS